ncbi:hypothetical protein J7L33_01270 [Candidatus Bathyarchaeota archaeon]|nr:hypothetical protein [Candidatus Bathyarchaeota archaeon]
MKTREYEELFMWITELEEELEKVKRTMIFLSDLVRSLNEKQNILHKQVSGLFDSVSKLTETLRKMNDANEGLMKEIKELKELFKKKPKKKGDLSYIG